MAEYWLRVTNAGAGPPQKVEVPPASDPARCAVGDAYLCGYCGIILRRGNLPLEPLTCSNCGAVNAPAVDGP